MKKVLVCKSVLLRYSETFIRDQVLAYSRWKPVLVGFRRVEGLPLDPFDVRLLDPHPPSALKSAYRKVLGEFGLPVPGVVQQLRREQASLVHVHFGTEAVALWPTLRQTKLPLAVTLHGYDINIYRESWEKGILRFGDRRYPARLLSLARQRNVRFIAVSDAIKRRAIEYGLPEDRIAVRYIGIDLSKFSTSGRSILQRRKRVLYVGRFVEKKGGEILIRAFARVRSAIPDAELVMVGDGPLAERFRELAGELNVGVEFPGRMTSEQVQAQLCEARVFCLPSVTAKNGDAEGLGIAILEAQSCGVPVITSARGGATEGILDGITGFAFAEAAVDSLVVHLLELLTNDPLAASMAQAGPKFVSSRFDIRSCTRALESLYDDMLAEA